MMAAELSMPLDPRSTLDAIAVAAWAAAASSERGLQTYSVDPDRQATARNRQLAFGSSPRDGAEGN
jgi:hypothetical protein